MTAFWLGVLVAVGIAATLVLTSWRKRATMAELGTVSDQWLSEQRGQHRNNSQQ